jgi:hypothetical protein
VSASVSSDESRPFAAVGAQLLYAAPYHIIVAVDVLYERLPRVSLTGLTSASGSVPLTVCLAEDRRRFICQRKGARSIMPSEAHHTQYGV